MTNLKSLKIWFIHGLKILGGGFGAYLIAIIPVVIIRGIQESNIGSAAVTWISILAGIILIPLCIAAFGFIFTKLYSNTTWGYDAVRDMKKRDGNNATTEKS